MTKLPFPSCPRAILSFDFDGTLHQHTPLPPVSLEFFAAIHRLRKQHDIVWGINTGRSLEQTIEGLHESNFPFLPDWVVGREREVYYSQNDGRWHPDAKWNTLCEFEIQRLFKRSENLLSRIRREVEVHTGARWMSFDGEPAGIISSTVDEMEWIIEHITPIIQEEPDFSWQRNSIYLRFGHRDFQKGSSLCYVAGHYGLPVERRFAIGDSHNDLEMLDTSLAGMIACPSNAVPDVKQKIQKQGGFLASRPFSDGTVEALLHYFG